MITHVIAFYWLVRSEPMTVRALPAGRPIEVRRRPVISGRSGTATNSAVTCDGEIWKDHHHLRHQELRHDEEGARLARQARRGLCVPRLQGGRDRAQPARGL